jgi:hypothetical protein
MQSAPAKVRSRAPVSPRIAESPVTNLYPSTIDQLGPQLTKLLGIHAGSSLIRLRQDRFADVTFGHKTNLAL